MVKDLIRPLLGKTTSSKRLQALLQYNDWIRSYAKQEGLTVLDLEKALRTSESDRSLRESFTVATVCTSMLKVMVFWIRS
jgi:hypothetical protein